MPDYVLNRLLYRILGDIQTILLHLAHFLEVVQSPHQSTQAALCRGLRFPLAKQDSLLLAIGSNDFGVSLIGFDAPKLHVSELCDHRRVQDAHSITLVVTVLGQRFVIGACGLHNDPGARFGMALKPVAELLEPSRIIGQLGFGARLAVGKRGGNVERFFGDINANKNGHDLLLQTTKVDHPTLSSTLLMRAHAGGGH
ncbi:hypothetical protein D3C76_1159740 [compost metagenome]